MIDRTGYGADGDRAPRRLTPEGLAKSQGYETPLDLIAARGSDSLWPACCEDACG
jgi:hypothetical protein